MEVTIGARCWDGQRKKSLSEVVKVEGLAVVEPKKRWDVMRDPKVKSLTGFAIPLVLLASVLPPIGLTHAFAQSMGPVGDMAIPVLGSATKGTILHAFDPLIDLIQALAYPIAGVMIAGGCLFIMVGNKEKGMSMLQNAAMGYILVQLTPLFLKLLVGVGASV